MNKKTSLIRICLLLPFVSAPGHTSAPALHVDSGPARILAEFQNLNTLRPPAGISHLELYQWSEIQALKRRELLLEFLEKYPTDPRRWILVDGSFSGAPRFVKDWGPLNEKGAPTQPVVDATAVTAWRAKVAALRAEMKAAPDVPETLRKIWAEREQAIIRYDKERAEFQERARAGRPAADFTMQDLAGLELNLSNYRGKVVVLDFWASWCGPCKAAMPHNQEIAAKYKDQGVVMLASCTNDTRDNFEEWVRANQAAYPDIIWAHDPVGKGDERASKRLYNVPGIPTQFIIDREGRVIDVIVGYVKGEVLLDAALAKAGIVVDAATLAKAAEDLRKRGN